MPGWLIEMLFGAFGVGFFSAMLMVELINWWVEKRNKAVA